MVSPVAYLVLLEGRASALWQLLASAVVLAYIGVASYITLFSLRYRMLSVYPLRLHHNTAPIALQTLATYMLTMINPICLWFTRMVVESDALLGHNRQQHGAQQHQQPSMTNATATATATAVRIQLQWLIYECDEW